MKNLYYTEQALENNVKIDNSAFDLGSFVEPHTFQAIYAAIPTPFGGGTVAPAGYHSSGLDVSPQQSDDGSSTLIYTAALVGALVYLLYYRR